MARSTHRLSALNVSRLKRPGYYPDGAGLYLQVAGKASKSWIFRFALRARAREMGLGSAADMSLAEARERASDCRKLLRDGIDPIEHRKVERAKVALAEAKSLTFKACAEAYMASHRVAWRNPKHADQWSSTLEKYAYPVFGSQPVQTVDIGLVMKVLEPMWTEKPETASRLRGRIEAILDWATVRGYRQGDNPARWRGAPPGQPDQSGQRASGAIVRAGSRSAAPAEPGRD